MIQTTFVEVIFDVMGLKMLPLTCHSRFGQEGQFRENRKQRFQQTDHSEQSGANKTEISPVVPEL